MKASLSKVFVHVLPACIAAIFIFLFFFGWMHANIDSYFYYAIGEYFRSGVYPYQEPFVYAKPTTISPPLYGLFFALTSGLPRADILLFSLQLLLLGATAFLVYRLLRFTVPERTARVISCLFAVFPVNIVYAGNAMTETAAQFAVTLWTYCAVTGMKRNNPSFVAVSVLVAAVATLLKYNLGIYFPVSLSVLLTMKKKTLSSLAAPVLGILLLGGWILINYRITGTWGLYDTRGTQLYNQFVAGTRLLPPETDPAVLRMRALLPPGTDIAVPYWDIQGYLSARLNRQWVEVDRVLADVAFASVRTHPFAYLLHSFRNYARIHYDHVPHWRNVGNIGIGGLTGTDKPFCGDLGTVKTCTPILLTPWSYGVWNAYVRTEMRLFEVLAAPFFFLILLPSLILGIAGINRDARTYALLYLIGTGPIAFTIHPDPRYVVPFYPLIVLNIVHTLVNLKTMIKSYKTGSP